MPIMGDAAVTDVLATAEAEAERLAQTLVAGHQGRAISEDRIDLIKRFLKVPFTAKVGDGVGEKSKEGRSSSDNHLYFFPLVMSSSALRGGSHRQMCERPWPLPGKMSSQQCKARGE